MKKYLITGISGFVSHHFLQYLERKKIDAVVKGLDIKDHGLPGNSFKHIEYSFENVQLLDAHQTSQILAQFQPDYILHLASYSSVASSWKNPIQSFQNNTNIFLNLLEAVRELGYPVRILSIGSSEEYGIVEPKDLPLTELHPLNPASPYAVARVAQEHLSKIYVEGYGLDIVMTRSFNHIGPYQREHFVIPSMVKQLLSIKQKGKRGELIAGNLDIVRDFTDVRDVVSAYSLLLNKGVRGEVYNVCSGKGYSLNDMVDLLCKILDIDVKKITDPGLIRPSELRSIVGSNDKIKRSLAWERKYDMHHSLIDIINYWESS